MYRNGKQKQDESVLLEVGRGLGMTGRGSLSTVPRDSSLYTEPTDPITELERGGGGGGRCLAPVSIRGSPWAVILGQAPAAGAAHGLPLSLKEGHFSELHAWPPPDCAQMPQGQRKKSSTTNQIQIGKSSLIKK